MAAIAPISIQVSPQDSRNLTTFTFSRTWHVTRLELKLSFGQIALLNVSFLVTDDEKECGDLLFGLLVLCHLGIDLGTLLEQKWSTLDDTDCSGIDIQARRQTRG